MSIPRNLCLFPLDTVKFPKCSDIFQSHFCLLLHQHVISCCRQHTTLFCIACIEWCYLLYTCHMDLSGTPIILGYFNIYHTIVVHTPCIHIRLTEDVDIIPLIHYPHVHFSCVWGSHRPWFPQILPQSLIGWIYLLACQRWGMPQWNQKLPRLFLNAHWWWVWKTKSEDVRRWTTP